MAQAARQLRYELKITQIDVADLAGVGKGTVSYALNGSDLIKPATRQKVMAFGAKAYLDEHGYRDVALAGYDDDPTAQFLDITSVRQPIDDVAKTLFDILLGEINYEPSPQRQVAFDPELVVRGSTKF